MYPDMGLLLLPLAVAFIWLGILSYLVIDNRSFLRSLFPRSGERDIRLKFDEIGKLVKKTNGDLSDFKDQLAKIEKHGWGFISRMEMMRYNPYSDTGGDQSFSLALLDKGGSGVVITSLHSRANTRVFAKPVILGKATKYSFSKEEEEVIKKAMSILIK
jgi:hypothetical protein